MKLFNKITFLVLLFAGISALYPMEKPDVAWGFSDRQGARRTMEDAYVYKKLDLKAGIGYYFGIFDGHGGARASRFAAQNASTFFYWHFQNNSQEAPDIAKRIAFAFNKSYVELDQAMQSQFEQDGTTAISALVLNDDVYIAWAGDSRAVIAAANGQIKRATLDHKPNEPRERKRIEAAGEKVQSDPRVPHIYRIFGRRFALSTARTLGDKASKCEIKPGAIIPNPDVFTVNNLKKGDFIILACDGLWDVMDNQEAVNFVIDNINKPLPELQKINTITVTQGEAQENDGNDAKLTQIARALRDRALKKGSKDNISVMVIQIQ